MKGNKRILSTALAFILILFMFPGSMAVQAVEKQLIIPKVGYVKAPNLEYTAGDIVNFDLHTPNYGGRVQYRAILWDDNKKEARDLWTTGDRYYTNWMPYGNNTFNLHWRIDEPGSYRITVYVKRAGISNNKSYLKGQNCDSYMKSQAFVVKPRISVLDRNGDTYGSLDVNKLEAYDNDISIIGQNITFNNAGLEGNLKITGDKAVIKNVSVTGKIIIDPGKDGSCTLDNVTAKEIQVLSGGENSIHIINSSADTLNVNSQSRVRIEADGDTEIVSTTANGYVIFDRKSGTFGTIRITKGENGEAVIEFRGNIQDEVVVETAATIRTGPGSSISSLSINTSNTVRLEGQYNNVVVNTQAKLEVGANTNIGNIAANDDAEIRLDSSAFVGNVDKNNNHVIIIGGSTGPSTGGGGYVPPSVAVTSITVTGAGDADLITEDNGTLQMYAAIEPANATNKAVTWSVTNGTGSAIISSTGLLTALSNGTVTVRATARDGHGKYGEKGITISGQVGAKISTASTITNGDINPEVVVSLANDTFAAEGVSTNPANWACSFDKTGLKIDRIIRDNNRQITFKLIGTAIMNELTLQAKPAALTGGFESNELSVKITPVLSSVEIKAAPNKVVYFSDEALDLTGLILALKYSDESTMDVAFEDFAANGITTSPSNGTILLVTNTAVTISVEGRTIAQGITVNEAPGVKSITISPSTATLIKGETLQLTAVVTVVGGVAETVNWTSSDATGRVTVDTTGLVAVRSDADIGNYTITATSTVDGSKSGAAVIQVIPPAMTGTVTITGAEKFGSTLTIDTSLTNSGTPKYQWKRAGEPISGATGATYTLVEEDITKTITVTVTADGIMGTGSITSSATGVIGKADGPLAPATPTLAAKTDRSITLNGNELQEYSRDNGTTWQTSPSFTGLTESTEYIFVTRVRETPTTHASGASEGTTIKTDEAVSATATPMAASPGTTTIKLGKAIPGLAAEDFSIMKNETLLNLPIDYNISGLDGTDVVITFTAAAGLDRTYAVTVSISKPGYYINGGNPITVTNNIPIAVKSITVLSEGDASIVLNGSTLQMSAVIAPETAEDKAIVWTVEPGTGTATINAGGLLTGTGAGTVTVNATNVASGVTGTKVIEVVTPTPPLNQLTLSEGADQGYTMVTAVSHTGAAAYKYKLQADAYNEISYIGMGEPAGFSLLELDTNIPAEAGKHLIVLALDGDGKVIATTDHTITDSEIRLQPVRIYMADYINNKVQVCTTTDSNPQILVPSVDASPYSGPMAITVSGGRVYWAEQDSLLIRSAALDGTDIMTVIEASNNISVIAVDEAGGRIYWADYTANSIYYTYLSGGEIELAISNADNSPVSTSKGPLAMTISGQKIYWAGDVSGTIECADLDGGNRQVVIAATITPQSISGIAVDEVNRRIYWSDYSTNSIHFAELDTGSTGVLIANADKGADIKGPLSIAVKNKRIYWVCDSNGEIRRVRLNGLEEEVMYTPLTPTFISGIDVE